MKLRILAGLVLTAASLSLVGEGQTAAAATVPCQKAYTQTVNAEIQTGAADTTTYISVPQTNLVSDVEVQVGIDHPNDQEVEIYLARSGYLTLSDHNGGTGDDYADTIFDDEAATPITEGAAPFGGRYRPEQAMTGFDGIAANGDWGLLVKDNSTGPGTLIYWRLILTFTSCDLDGDSVEDHSDNCLGLPNAGQTNTDGDAQGDACDPNDDNDALIDSKDACDRLAAKTSSGCPAKSRSITLGYGSGRFHGQIKSALAACTTRRPVTIWRVVDGPDLKVGEATSTSSGEFALSRARRPGTYYAVTPRVVVPDKGECARTVSPRLVLR